MSGTPKQTVSTVIPCMRYRDAPAAIEWLCRAFGFEKRLVVSDEEGGITHAQLSFGNGMIMLGSVRDDDFGKLLGQPDPTETQTPYIIVENIDEHYARAIDAGAAGFVLKEASAA